MNALVARASSRNSRIEMQSATCLRAHSNLEEFAVETSSARRTMSRVCCNDDFTSRTCDANNVLRGDLLVRFLVDTSCEHSRCSRCRRRQFATTRDTTRVAHSFLSPTVSRRDNARSRDSARVIEPKTRVVRGTLLERSELDAA
jgi:hypothetical protein